MTEEISLLVTIEVQDGKAQDQIDAYRALLPQVLAEDGCLQYELTQVVNDPNRFILVERWASAEALAAHSVAPHMVEAGAKNAAFRAKPAQLVKLKVL